MSQESETKEGGSSGKRVAVKQLLMEGLRGGSMEVGAA